MNKILTYEDYVREVADAESPEKALKIAKDQWKRDHRKLIVSGSEDEDAAFGWRPTAEPSTNC